MQVFKLRKNRLLISACALFILVLLGIVSSSYLLTHHVEQQTVPAIAGQQLSGVNLQPKTCANSSPDNPQVIRSCDFGIWKYSVAPDEQKKLHVSVYYRHDSVNDLKKYAAANKTLLAQAVQLGGEVRIAVTFHNVVKPDKFREWAKANGIQVEQVQLTTGGVGFSRVTIGVGGKPGDPLPQSVIDQIGPVQGVFGVYCTVAASRLSQIANDPLVFLVDVTPALVPNDLAKDGIPGIAPSDVEVFLAFAYMENLGLQNFSVGVPPNPSVPLPSPVLTFGPTIPVPALTGVSTLTPSRP